jgi:hypothetical protein
VLRVDRLGEENRNPNPNCWLCYHVKNNTCIHLRVKGLNTYMYRRGRIYKELLKKYNNKKANAYLIRTMELAKEKPVSAQWFLI